MARSLRRQIRVRGLLSASQLLPRRVTARIAERSSGTPVANAITGGSIIKSRGRTRSGSACRRLIWRSSRLPSGTPHTPASSAPRRCTSRARAAAASADRRSGTLPLSCRRATDCRPQRVRVQPEVRGSPLRLHNCFVRAAVADEVKQLSGRFGFGGAEQVSRSAAERCRPDLSTS